MDQRSPHLQGGSLLFTPPEFTRNRTHWTLPRDHPQRPPHEIRQHPEKVPEVREGELTLLTCPFCTCRNGGRGGTCPRAPSGLLLVFGVRTQPPTPRWRKWVGMWVSF